MLDRLLDRLDRKVGRYAVRHLITWIVAGMALVYILNYLTIFPLRGRLISDLSFSRAKIFQGEIWRLVTFIFVPTTSSVFLVIQLYFYWMIGTAL